MRDKIGHWLLIVVWLLVLGYWSFLSACGGYEQGPPDRLITVALNWQDQSSAFVSNYAALLTAKAVLNDSEVTASVEDNSYLFNFQEIAEGDYTLQFNLYNGEEQTASANLPITINNETEILLQLNSSELINPNYLISLNPRNTDIDGDGLSDAQEISLGTNPLLTDTDGDILSDGAEAGLGTSPLLADTDSDDYNDSTDAFPLDTEEWLDADRDGVGDNRDNCVNAANTDQSDTNSDGTGDVCSDDDDGDGLRDAREAELGTNSHLADTDGDSLSDSAEVASGTNPLAIDTDGDGYNDSDDSFPLDSSEWMDSDRDGVGDNRDNCPNAPNSDQRNTDREYSLRGITTPTVSPIVPDGLGNTCESSGDNDIDGYRQNIDTLHARDAVYVSAATGSDSNLGTFFEPVRSLSFAIGLAINQNSDVYVAAGSYTLAGVTFADNVNLYGGFASGFGSRRVHDETTTYKTELTRSDSPVTLRLENLAGSFKLDGFFITNSGVDDGIGGILPDTDEYGCSQATVYIANSRVTLENNIITGSTTSQRPCGVLINRSANTRLNANKINANGLNTSVQSTGISIVDASPILTNNIIIAGNAKRANGLRTTNTSAVVTNNTIDARSNAIVPLISNGVIFDRGTPKFINNIIFTGSSDNQSVFQCIGANLTGAEIKNNILTTFPQTGTNSVLINCDGIFTLTSGFIISPTFTLTGADVIGNVAYLGDLSGLVDAGYSLAGLTGVDAGLNTNTDTYGNVSLDYNQRARAGAGAAFDIGAIER